MLDSTDRTIMISGANRGLGNAIAKRLHADGYNVSVGGRDIDALTASMDDCDGAVSSPVSCGVSSRCTGLLS